jgi:asparagine synthase (glutamine-hydrolysing)
MRRSVEGLHNVNLQRVDRMTMRHGIEGRVPFLDTELIELALTIPPHWKLHRMENGRRVEKWILRKAFEDLLPRDIVWRDKEQFDEGSGTVEMLDQLITEVVDTTDWQSYQRMHERDRLRSAEECHYHRMLVASLERPDPVLRNVGRWTGGQF